jgi:hypothetical protein
MGVFYAGRLSYSSTHYLYFLIPVLILSISAVASELSKRLVGRLLVSLFATAFLYSNLLGQVNYDNPGHLLAEQKLAQRLGEISQQKPLSVKFVDVDVLILDAVVYDELRQRPTRTHMRLLERWNMDPANALVSLHDLSPKSGKLAKFGNINLLVHDSQP